MSKLANTGKHVVALAPMPLFHVAETIVTGGLVSIPDDGWDGEKHELTLAYVREGHQFQMDAMLGASVVFADVPALRTIPVPDVLASFIGAVEGIIRDLETEVAAILTTRD